MEQVREAATRGALGIAIRDKLAEVWLVFHIEDWLRPGTSGLPLCIDQFESAVDLEDDDEPDVLRFLLESFERTHPAAGPLRLEDLAPVTVRIGDRIVRWPVRAFLPADAPAREGA